MNPAAAGGADGPGFNLGGGAGGQQEPEDGDAPEGAGDGKNVLNAAEGDGFGELVRRQGVGLPRIAGLRIGGRG